MEIGGNKISYWIGGLIKKFGERIIQKTKPTTISNPSAKLANPFTLIISFTIDSDQKYQVVTQGKYYERYKNTKDGLPEISENEMLMVISSKKNQWFKKE